MRKKRRDSVARLPTGPAQGSEPLGLKIRNHPNRITRRERLLQRSYRSQLENGPIRWARTSESNPLYTSVDASRPHAASADNAGRRLVEPPGIAPGSGPLITSAFIAIVRPKPDRSNIGGSPPHSKRIERRAQSRLARNVSCLKRSAAEGRSVYPTAHACRDFARASRCVVLPSCRRAGAGSTRPRFPCGRSTDPLVERRQAAIPAS